MRDFWGFMFFCAFDIQEKRITMKYAEKLKNVGRVSTLLLYVNFFLREKLILPINSN